MRQALLKLKRSIRHKLKLDGNISLNPPRMKLVENATHGRPQVLDRLPVHILRLVFESLAADSSQYLLAPCCLCKALTIEVEAVLYSRVSVGPDVSQLRTFLTSIVRTPRRAAAVQVLHLTLPLPSFRFILPRPTTLQKIASKVTRTQPPGTSFITTRSRLRVNDSLETFFKDLMTHAFRVMSNLVVLDFPGLEAHPEVLYRATFHLRELRTTPDGLIHLHVAENRRLPRKNGTPQAERVSSALPKLLALHTLKMDVKDRWEGRVPRLRNVLTQYNIAHLAIEGASSRQVARECLPLVCQRLVSFRFELGICQGVYDAPEDLWPTQILRDVVLPHLTHLELYETKFRYLPPRGRAADGFVHFDAHVRRLMTACPSIKRFVWKPSAYHTLIAVENTRFRDAFPQYAGLLFSVWPTLERFEGLEVEDARVVNDHVGRANR